jgi:hypothetical protein
MTRQDKQAVLSAIEQLEDDLKFMLTQRRLAQAALDAMNSKVQDAFTRLRRLEAYVEEQG